MYDLARLAFETDSTRAVTLMLNSVGTPGRADPGQHDHRRLPQPLAPRKGRREAHAAQGDRRMAHEAAWPDLFTELKAVEGGRRDAAGSDDGAVRLEPRRRQRALDDEHADSSPAAASVTASICAFDAAQLSAAEPVRLDAPAHGH